MRDLPTTDPEIAVGNMRAQIAGAENILDKQPQSLPAMKSLVSLYASRAQIFGQLADYDRAMALAEKLVHLAPADGETYALRASCRATFHQFPEALADLDEAEKRGQRRDELAAARASIFQALGRTDEALAIRQKKADDWATISSLGALASVHADRGETDEAERLYIRAQEKFSDVSPFVLAWLYLQEGLMWQKAGMLSRARELFEAAHERLPDYAPVTSHLAAVEAVTGGRERALGLLKPLVEASDDPEYAGQLSSLYAESGARDEAVKLRARAAVRYDELVKQHPAAFADHAARFWLGPGADPKRALELARKNLAVRQTSESYELVIEAALAAGADPIACDAAQKALALPRPSPSVRVAAARTGARCKTTVN